MPMPEAGIWYQPRSLWSVLYVATAQTNLNDFPYRFNRKHFKNGTRWPITLTRMAVSPVNYPVSYLDNLGAGAPNTGTPHGYGIAMLKGARIRISAPFRKSYSRQEIALGNYAALPTGQPHGTTGYDSSLFGLSYLNFEKPLIVAENSACMLQTGGLSAVRFIPTGSEEQFDVRFDLATPIYANYFFNQAGGMFSGAQRNARGSLEQDFPNVNPEPDLDTGYPFGLPGVYLYIPGAPGTVNWPPNAQITAAQFDKQGSTRSGSNLFYGMGVMVDQIEYDDGAAASAEAEGLQVDQGGFRIAPLSTRLGCRARMSHGVNTDWWWRPGAPMALVLDTITPALVYQLPEPITLGPGETLNVEGMFPGVEYFGSDQGDNDEKLLQVGVSFNGYTAIEG